MVKEMSCMDNHQLEHFHYFILEVYFCKVWLMEGSSSLKALNTFGIVVRDQWALIVGVSQHMH